MQFVLTDLIVKREKSYLLWKSWQFGLIPLRGLNLDFETQRSALGRGEVVREKKVLDEYT